MVTDHWIFRSSVFYLLTSYNMINQHIYIRRCKHAKQQNRLERVHFFPIRIYPTINNF